MSLFHSTLTQTLLLFNARSRDPADHFKLVVCSATDRPYLRLCCSHPHLVTCACDERWVHVRDDGPRGERLRFEHGCVESLGLLLAFLQARRGDGDELVDWELEDWVGAGFSCRMRGKVEARVWGLDFGVDDLWCVDLVPNIQAGLPPTH